MIRFYAPPPVDAVEEVELPRQADRTTRDDTAGPPQSVGERRDPASPKSSG